MVTGSIGMLPSASLGASVWKYIHKQLWYRSWACFSSLYCNALFYVMRQVTLSLSLSIGFYWLGTWTFWTHTWFCTWYCRTGWCLLFPFFSFALTAGMLNNSTIIYIQDKANPFATVLSAAMLLRYGLGEEKAAKRIENAVVDTLNRGFRTGDIYSAGTVSISFINVEKTSVLF